MGLSGAGPVHLSAPWAFSHSVSLLHRDLEASAPLQASSTPRVPTLRPLENGRGPSCTWSLHQGPSALAGDRTYAHMGRGGSGCVLPGWEVWVWGWRWWTMASPASPGSERHREMAVSLLVTSQCWPWRAWISHTGWGASVLAVPAVPLFPTPRLLPAPKLVS